MDSAGLQSGFVIAVVIGAILLAEHLGGPGEVARRLFQVALAVAVTLAVVSGTTAFIRPPEYDDVESAFESFDEDSRGFYEEAADRETARGIIQFTLGVALVALGALRLRSHQTTSLGVVLGGVLLLLFGGTSGGDGADPFSGYLAAFSTVMMGVIGSSQQFDIAAFVVTTGGALALLAVGVWYWDAPPVEPADAASGAGTTP